MGQKIFEGIQFSIENKIIGLVEKAVYTPGMPKIEAIRQMLGNKLTLSYSADRTEAYPTINIKVIIYKNIVGFLVDVGRTLKTFTCGLISPNTDETITLVNALYVDKPKLDATTIEITIAGEEAR